MPTFRSASPRFPTLLLFALVMAVAPGARAQRANLPPADLPLANLPLAAYEEQIAALHEQDGDTGARRALAVVRQVRLPDGTIVTLDTTTFAASASDADAIARARTIDDLLEGLAPTPDGPDPKAAARAILSDPEFAEATAKNSDNWFDQLLRRIGRALRRFFDWLFGGRPDIPQADGGGFAALFAQLLRFLLFVGVTLGVVWGGLYVSRLVTTRKRARRADVLTGLDLEDDIADPLGAAKELARRGETRQALRLAYIACLRRLASAGLLVLRQSRTNWEYQSALQSRSRDAAATLLPATRLFDLVWYGRRDATLEEWEQVLAIHDALPAPLVETASHSGTAAAAKESGNGW